MLKLEDIKQDAHIRGLVTNATVRIIRCDLSSADAAEVFYIDADGKTGNQMLFRQDESRLALADAQNLWTFDAPGEAFKLSLEAHRISLAHLFDPMMAVHTSNVEPLPHQISAVYESLLPLQPLRFVLADDPGSGKTIMAGLYIRELIMRSDAKRILIVSPGSLSEQWQDELQEKFGLHFEIFSREKQEQCATGNFFEEQNQLIARLDQLSRNEGYQEKLKSCDWDLVVVDEAHKMSAHYYGREIRETKRFKLGKLLGAITRHYLLLTATPHNGKEEAFQLFLSLLDGDRFYGKFREGAHKIDTSDVMRRMVKEDLLKFDATPLFPERKAYTVNYYLSDQELALYDDVTDYVRNEMNRADALDGKKRNAVGFALTLLQRRLASSPEAIYQSLKRRHKKLEGKLDEMRRITKGEPEYRGGVAETLVQYVVQKQIDIPDNLDEADEELSGEEYEAWAEQVIDQTTAADTIPELEAEIATLKDLESKANDVVKSGSDKKWEQLSDLLQKTPEMHDRAPGGPAEKRRKLIIFTEHKDTLAYLEGRISGLIGKPGAVVSIHGGTNRDERRRMQEEFRNNPDVLVMVATDAAGEGVNLQNANLMINYDLPWNPNRLEQRFGRIHRIGQTEVCHLWNIVATETREGAVFQKLLEKLAAESAALGGKVFDILGEAFEDVSLKSLLLEAIRYGEKPEVRAKLNQAIDGALDTEHLKEIIKRNALVDQEFGLDQLYAVKEEMEKAEARKLQPYFIRAFFNDAFEAKGGQMRGREAGRFEIRHVPAALRGRNGQTRTPVLKKYERVCFEKQYVHAHGKPMADLLHPGHPLMQAMIDRVLEEHGTLLKQGAVLVDPNDEGAVPRVFFMIDHNVRQSADNTVVSRRLQFVEIDQDKKATNAGWAPHLDLQPINKNDLDLVKDVLDEPWIANDLEQVALNHASTRLMPEHYEEVKYRREQQIDKIHAAVHERLVKEIDYYASQEVRHTNEIAAGKPAHPQLERAKRQQEELRTRLELRKKELATMRDVVSSSPVVIGGCLVIPQGLLARRKGEPPPTVDAAARARIEQIAMEAVVETEQTLGHEVKDVSAEKCGWDVTARPPMVDGRQPEDRHVEVKGRAKGQNTITVTRNEMLYAMNQADKFLLAIVIVDGDSYEGPHYIRNPFDSEPGFGVASVNYNLSDLLSKAVPPGETL